MQRPFLLLAALACTAPVYAQLLPEQGHGAYLSGQLGNGIVSGGNARGDRGMNWLAFEARGGHGLDPALFGADGAAGLAHGRIDFVYYNEGHPENNRRDGFAVQFTYVRALGSISAEIGAGPYTSMNTTTIDGAEIDQARKGILATVALRYPLEQWGAGTHLRLAWNHVWMHDVHHSDALMLGLGRDFSAAPALAVPSDRPLWFGLALGRSITNLAGGQASTNLMLQAKQYVAPWAFSLSAIEEGDDKQRVDRRGVAAQAWFVRPLTPHWTFSAGLGPYLAHNDREGRHNDTLGLFTIQIERTLSPGRKAFFAFNRVQTFHERNDRDLFQLGLLSSFR